MLNGNVTAACRFFSLDLSDLRIDTVLKDNGLSLDDLGNDLAKILRPRCLFEDYRSWSVIDLADIWESDISVEVKDLSNPANALSWLIHTLHKLSEESALGLTLEEIGEELSLLLGDIKYRLDNTMLIGYKLDNIEFSRPDSMFLIYKAKKI